MKKKEFLFILISSSILVFAWIIFSVLESAMNSTISESLQVQTSAIQGTFDTKVIERMKTRQQITPVNIDSVIPETASSSAAIPTPVVTLVPQPSTPQVSITPEITP